MTVRIKRAFDPPDPDDGRRVLVDGMWPRGLKRERLHIDEWAREIAPSRELRTWFGHRPERWEGFRNRYREELAGPDKAGILQALTQQARSGNLTLVFAARDQARNNAVVLKEAIEEALRRT